MVFTELVALGTAAYGIGSQIAEKNRAKKKQREQQATAYGDLAGQYSPQQQAASQAAQDAAMTQGLGIAGQGTSAGARAAMANQAMMQAPKAAAHAELLGHQTGANYAGLANNYMGTRASSDLGYEGLRGGRDDQMQAGISNMAAGIQGAYSGVNGGDGAAPAAGSASPTAPPPVNEAPAAAGAAPTGRGYDVGYGPGQVPPEISSMDERPIGSDRRMKKPYSDEETKNFNRKVGTSVGFPGDDMPVSDKRAKDLEAENARLRSQVRASSRPEPGTGGRPPFSVNNPQPAQFFRDKAASYDGSTYTGYNNPDFAENYQGGQPRRLDPNLGAAGAAGPPPVDERTALARGLLEQDRSAGRGAFDTNEGLGMYDDSTSPEMLAWMKSQGMSPEQAAPPAKASSKARAVGRVGSKPGTSPQKAAAAVVESMDDPSDPYSENAVESVESIEAPKWTDERVKEWRDMRWTDDWKDDFVQSMDDKADPYSEGPVARGSAEVAEHERNRIARERADYERQAAFAKDSGWDMKKQIGEAFGQPPRSDEDMKRGVRPGSASAIFEKTPGYDYEYKDEFQGQPGTKPGPQYGIMAQDLEKTPQGAAMVEEDEEGMKRVDAQRLAMATPAALNEILGRLKALEGSPRG